MSTVADVVAEDDHFLFHRLFLDMHALLEVLQNFYSGTNFVTSSFLHCLLDARVLEHVLPEPPRATRVAGRRHPLGNHAEDVPAAIGAC